MLGRILVRYLKPFRLLLVGVVIFQAGQSIAALSLPNLNATSSTRAWSPATSGSS